MVWTIEARQFGLFGGNEFGHLYIEVWDSNNKRIDQLNGLCFNPDLRNGLGDVDPAGMPYITNDEIRGFSLLNDDQDIFGSLDKNIRENVYSLGDDRSGNTDPSVVLFQGTEQQVLKALDYAYEAMKYINAQHLDYSPVPNLSAPFIEVYNSNSFFLAMVKAMSQAVTIDQDDFDAAKELGSISNPGVGLDIFQGIAWSPNINGSGNVVGSIVDNREGEKDELIGAAGDDIFYATNEEESVNGGDGFDTLSYAHLSRIEYDEGGKVSVEKIIGTNGNDVFDIGTNEVIIVGGGGVDTYQYDQGLGGGHDTISDNGGILYLDGFNAEYWTRNSTSSPYTFLNYFLAFDGSGNAIIRILGDTDVHGNYLNSLTISNIGNWNIKLTTNIVGDSSANNIDGEEYSDNIQGRGNSDTIRGLAGSDTLDGGDDDDTLEGGDDDDVLIGGDGADDIDGGDGIDWAYYNSSSSGFMERMMTIY